MITISKECTACGACVQKCPKACIAMREDENGFLFPHVEVEKCIECGKCNYNCPANRTITQSVRTMKRKVQAARRKG